MLGSGFRLYAAYDTVTTPKTVDTLLKTDGDGNGPGTVSMNDLITAGFLKLADELKDVTETGTPNTINTTTRSTGRLGVQSSEITTLNVDLSAQLVYEPHTAFGVGVSGYEILDVLEYCMSTKSPIFIIDLDKPLSTDGGKGRGANYTVALSQPREVEGQVVYDATFALKSFYQQMEYHSTGSVYKAIVNP